MVHKVDHRVVPNQEWAAHRAAASAVLRDWADKARAPVVDKTRVVTWAADPVWAPRAKALRVVIPAVVAALVPVIQEPAATRVDPAAVKVACNAFLVTVLK